MKYLPISSLKEKPQSGTEYKFYFTLADGTPVLAKPMRLVWQLRLTMWAEYGYSLSTFSKNGLL